MIDPPAGPAALALGDARAPVTVPGVDAGACPRAATAEVPDRIRDGAAVFVMFLSAMDYI